MPDLGFAPCHITLDGKKQVESDIVDYFLSFILGILSKWLQGLAVSLISESAQFLPVFQLSRYK